MAKKDKRLWLDMCAGSELMDTQGETLSVEGADISELRRLNDNHGKGFFNNLGIITESKKIFKREDCENERQEYYWNKIKAPYIYAKGYLHNDEDHPNARAAAAILRNIHREDCPLKLKSSVEGGVVARGIKDPSRLVRTKIHSVALTFTPANNATLVEPLNLDKSNSNWETDRQLIKSVMHLAETNVPSFRHIERHASANTIHDNILKIQELAKSLGIDIEIKESNPDNIMKNAVLHKVSNNISKINHLVKAIRNMQQVMSPAPKTSPGKVAMAAEEQKATKLKAADEFQQKIGKLKNDPTTPTKPKDLTQNPSGTMKVQNASKVKVTNTLKSHASKAMKDPEHLNNIQKQLIERGMHPDKVNAIINKIKEHLVKSIDENKMEKGELGQTAKNLLLAGTMAIGINQSARKVPKNQLKTEIKREIASKPKKPKSTRFEGENADYFNAIDDKQKIRANKVKAKYSKIKSKLKKALTAGYGGAGAPSAMTGGSVIQSESLDDGRAKKTETTDGFSYISCDTCGHEQVYMKHQVKCRKCRKNFSLDKLQNHF